MDDAHCQQPTWLCQGTSKLSADEEGHPPTIGTLQPCTNSQYVCKTIKKGM